MRIVTYDRKEAPVFCSGLLSSALRPGQDLPASPLATEHTCSAVPGPHHRLLYIPGFLLSKRASKCLYVPFLYLL